jgi:hypothetical protein
MPFALIPTALGICFCLIWLFIGGMIFRDGHLARQRELEGDAGILPIQGPHTVGRTTATTIGAKRPVRKRVVRVAS